MNSINWQQLQTASGDGSHLIAAIENLASSSEEIRESAYWKIDNYVVRQSDLYEASYYVIEPLVELLEKEYSVDRTLPLCALVEIALGGNGDIEIVLQDTGVKTSIKAACQDKLSKLAPRISKIVTRTEEEEKEKETLLEHITR